ncbi:MAG: DNA-directed RNA polymerase subunit omega [Leptospirales bacterium]
MSDLITRPIEVTQDMIDSRYRLVIAAAKRARQLMEGVPPKVEVRYQKETTTALQEIVSKKIYILMGDEAARIETKRREKLRERAKTEERFSYSRGYALESSEVIHADVMTYHAPEEDIHEEPGVEAEHSED